MYASGVKKESGQLNKTNRLITFGCSYTFGIGLPDCKYGDKNPSKLGWPTLLSDRMGAELVNISASGASNFEILYNILNFDFQDTDTVVIMWTHFYREYYFTKWFPLLSNRQFGPWTTGRIARKWVEQMNDKDFAMKSWAHIHHAGLYLKSKAVKHIHFPAWPNDLLKYPVNYEISNLYLDGFVKVDLGHDNGHPGVESNKQTAERIYYCL